MRPADEEPARLRNLLHPLPSISTDEDVLPLLEQRGVRIERIVSRGQTTPVETPYDQDHDEWVLLLAGAARLWIEGTGEHDLGPGDQLLIEAHRRHRVTWTVPDEPTVWLAVHLPALAGLSGTGE